MKLAFTYVLYVTPCSSAPLLALNMTCLNDVFTGPTLIAFSKEHPGAAARIFKEFAKGQDKFEIKAAAFEGKFLAANQIDVLASSADP